MAGTASDVVQGRVYAVSVDGTALDLIADESFSFDAGESTSSFDLSTNTTTQQIPGQYDPQISFDLLVEVANQAGLETLGVVDVNGEYQFESSTRSIGTVTVDVLDAEAGTVEIQHVFSDVLMEFSGLDDATPVEMSVTGYINGGVTIAANTV
jgi:hypothetical protein